jgi:hypothetical protein
MTLARHIVAFEQSSHGFSQSTGVHAMAPTHTPAQLLLVAVGVMVVALTTVYTLRCFIRPEEGSKDHIKRRILDEGWT